MTLPGRPATVADAPAIQALFDDDQQTWFLGLIFVARRARRWPRDAVVRALDGGQARRAPMCDTLRSMRAT